MRIDTATPEGTKGRFTFLRQPRARLFPTLDVVR
jgi:hypothetical protein